MPDQDTVGQEPNDSGQEPQTDQSSSAGTDAQDGQEPKPEQFDAEYVKKLRSEAADYRKRLRELEAKVKADEEAKLSEQEKLQKRLSELEREREAWALERQERTVRYEVMLAASKLNIVDPEAAYKLLDLSTLEFDDEGLPTNLDKSLKDLLKARPYLVRAQQPASINADEGRGQKPNVDPKAREAELRQRFRF